MSGLIDAKRHGNIMEVAFNRPETYNAFNLEMITELAQNLTGLAVDETVKGIIL